MLPQWKEHHLPCFVPGKDTVVASTAGEYNNLIAPFGHQVPSLVFTHPKTLCSLPTQTVSLALPSICDYE